MFYENKSRFKILVAHGANLGYGSYGTADNDSNSNRKLHHIKSHQQINTGQLDNSRPIEEMPYQVRSFYVAYHHSLLIVI